MSVYVLPYDPRWPQQFERERARLLDAIGDHLDTVEHVGSTSVPGLAAKPVIDMMPGVRSLAEFDSHLDAIVLAMQAAGYIYRKDLEPMLPERRYFVLRGDNPHHPRGDIVHAHVVEIGSDFWERHLIFRDYLIAHPDERNAYGAFKQDIAPKYADTHQYSAAKADFIDAMEARALAWAKR